MSTNRVQAAKKLIAAAEIQNIGIVKAKLTRISKKKGETTVAPFPQGRRMAVKISHSGKAELEQEGVVCATVHFVLEAREVGREERKPDFRVEVSFELDYKIPADLDPPRDELRAFAETNAIFNAWPYWREFVQNMTARANLPPLTLPLFRILPQRK